MEEFVRARHHAILGTTRSDGDMQLSPVTMGMGEEGSVLISSYPERAKARNLRRRPQASVCVLSDSFGDAWIQLSGSATVVDLPDALDGLVEYFRSISGEHPDWDEYRRAMITQGKVLIRIDIRRWGPISTGGFPPRLAES
jgi:PPOX class probable F420-dependent enzyme